MGIDHVICDLDRDLFTGDPNSDDHNPLFSADTFSITITNDPIANTR